MLPAPESDPGVLNVYIVEDDDALRDDLCRAVQTCTRLRLFGATGSAQEALRVLRQRPAIDVLLVDLGLPDGDGTDVIRAMRTELEQAQALVISVFADDRRVLPAFAAGARGYLLKDASDEDLVRAVLDVAEGDAPVSPQVARHLLRAFDADAALSGRSKLDTSARRLTAREAEILTLVSQGHSGPEVATHLGLSLHTVNTHLRRCHQKLEARNRLQAVKLARDSGLID